MKTTTTRGVVSEVDLATTQTIFDLLDPAGTLTQQKTFSHEDSKRCELILKHAEILDSVRGGKEAMRNSQLAVAERKAGLDAASHQLAFADFLRFGIGRMSQSYRDILQKFYRAQALGTGAAGGYLVPDSFSDQVEEALKSFSAVRRIASVRRTPDGRDFGYPTVNDVTQIGELLAENAVSAEQDATFAQLVFKSYKYSSKLIQVSVELLEDSKPDLEAVLASLFARRIGVLQNLHYTSGNGTGLPLGFLASATVGKTGAAGQLTSILWDDLIDLLHSVDPLYRVGDSVVWMMNDATLKALRKVKDSAGQPLVTQQPDTRDTILGYRVIVNQDMPVMAASAKSIAFGDFSRYVVRDSCEFAVVRLSELFATQRQVGFIAFMRSDGRMLDAGTNPIKVFFSIRRAKPFWSADSFGP